MQVQLLEVGAAFPKALMDASQARHLMLVALEPIMILELTSGQAQYPWGYHLSAFEMQVHYLAYAFRASAYILESHTTQEYVRLLTAITDPIGHPHFLPAVCQVSAPKQPQALPSAEGPPIPQIKLLKICILRYFIIVIMTRLPM